MDKAELIDLMLEAEVLTFGDFTTKSGRRTPYFINTGNYRTGKHIARLGDFYAACIARNIGKNFEALFGPAYKGIPLAAVTAVSLYRSYQWDIPYLFNRKEAKDHGEGGNIIGYKPQDGNRIVIVEDVATAGTSVRESLDLLRSIADIKVIGLVVLVDRRERGTGELSALQELEKSFGIKTYSLVTIDEIVAYLHNRKIDGRIILDDAMKAKVDGYRKQYGV
ncbi:MAG: orotate phosphoribosyltransferase [Bacillota bacterium]